MEQITFDFTIFSIAGLVVFAAYFSGGLIDSVCGGGGLITVPVLMTLGMPAHMTVGTNQVSLIPGCATALFKYTKSGNIDWKVSFIALPFSLIGAFIGARLNILISEKYLQIILLVLLPVMAVFSVIKKDVGEKDLSHTVSNHGRIIGAVAIGLSVSAYHAFYGPASGMFYMIAFAVFLRMNLLKGNGISRFLVSISSLISSITYSLAGMVCWKVIPIAALAYILGNYIGAGIALTKGSKFIRPVYYCVLLMLFVKLIFDYFG